MLAAVPLPAQAPGVSETYAQIRTEETNNSRIMWIIHEIADVYGPRVTGTPNLKAADDWAVKTMTSWGLANTHLEPWTFQPPSAATPVPGWEKHGPSGGSRYAVPRATHGEAPGVDAEHKGSRDGASGDAGSSRIDASAGWRIQPVWGCAATTGTEMGGTADAGGGEGNAAKPADTAGA